jgi:hypothetical protein
VVNSPTVTAQIDGQFTGILAFEVPSEAGSFVAATAHQGGTVVSSVSTSGTWTIDTEGKDSVQVRATTWNSGKASVLLSAQPPPSSGAPVAQPQAAAPGQPAAKPNKDAAGSTKSETPTEPAPGVMTCTGKENSLPCTVTRTFTSVDLEWWDVSIGITTPGVRESKYSIVNSKLTNSPTTHTDFYAMLDLYPFAPIAAKNDWAPHFNLGVPITGQSLYRPYFGVAESVGGFLTRIFRPERQLGLPMDINVFGGMTWMKTQIVSDSPTTSSQLTADTQYTRVWKPVFGVEVPISSIASKIKGAGSKNTNGSGKTSSAAGK